MLRLSSEQTDGAFEVFEFESPDKDGPPPHIHRTHEELFYVVQGQVEFTLGKDQFTLEAGSLVFVPRDTRHAFTLGPGAKTLGLVAPAGLEGFFTDLGVGMAAGKTSEEIRAALEARHDSHPA